MSEIGGALAALAFAHPPNTERTTRPGGNQLAREIQPSEQARKLQEPLQMLMCSLQGAAQTVLQRDPRPSFDLPTKRYLNIELLRNLQMRGAVTA